MNTPKAVPSDVVQSGAVEQPRCTFEQRNAKTIFNLLFSYGAQDDLKAAELGYEFLGAGCDEQGSEVHVFQKKSLADHQLGA